jgi:hypothetical protein
MRVFVGKLRGRVGLNPENAGIVERLCRADGDQLCRVLHHVFLDVRDGDCLQATKSGGDTVNLGLPFWEIIPQFPVI